MKKSIYSSVAILALVIIAVISVIAQQSDQQKLSSQRLTINLDTGKLSEKLIDRRVELALKSMELSEEESKALKPKLLNILKLRFEQYSEMKNLIDKLQKAIEADDDHQINSGLAEVKTRKKEHKAALEALENDLIKSLKMRQEAHLTVLGIVNGEDVIILHPDMGIQEKPEASRE